MNLSKPTKFINSKKMEENSNENNKGEEDLKNLKADGTNYDGLQAKNISASRKSSEVSRKASNFSATRKISKDEALTERVELKKVNFG